MSWQNQKRRGQNRAGQEVLGSGQRTNQPRSGSSEKLDVDRYYMKAQYHSYNIGNTQGDIKTWCQILCSMRLQCVSKIWTPRRMLKKCLLKAKINRWNNSFQNMYDMLIALL